MKAIEKTLEYYELIMTLDNLNTTEYTLPKGYKIEFWNDNNCINDWIKIHLETGEFASLKEAEVIFHMYYDRFYNELPKRCFFISDTNGIKIATATISPIEENGYNCAIDWLGISINYQGRGLGNALLSKTIALAKELGYDKLLLHTQTHTWLAAKLYLDFGFKPFNIDEKKGWQILKTLTNHKALDSFTKLNYNELFDIKIINIKNELSKIYNTFHYSVWYIDGRNDVFVNEENKFYHYKFFDNGNTLKLVK